MAEDIVTQLLDVVCWCHEFDGVCDACQAADEIKRLRRWKTEATTVLAEWDAVWECAGKGTLGESKQRGVVAELGRLDDEIERLRAEVERKADYAERMDALAEERLIGWNRERALADQLAQALRWSWELEDATHDEVFGVMASAANALAAYKRDREGK